MKTIRALRRERGWTQFELAIAVGVQPQTIYLWESGRRQPQVPQMRKLGEVFGLCSDEIDLEPAADGHRGGSHRTRSARRRGEASPARGRSSPATNRIADEADSRHEAL
jgi:DNA-binding XRE family transcriptional regulator